MNQDTKPILLFDGVCNLCNRLVQFIIKRDPRATFRFASLQSESGQALLESFELPKDKLDTFVYLRGEKIYLKSSAVLHVLKDLGGGWKLLYVFIIVPKPLRDLVYTLVSKTRYNIFGKKDQCMIPSKDISSRFLE